MPRIQGTVILAFDVSGSMAADDMEPTRMDAAKAAVENFVERQPPTVQIGVVAFSDCGLSVQAPTDDQGAVLGAITRLTPQRGVARQWHPRLSSSDRHRRSGCDQLLQQPDADPAPSPTPVPRGTRTTSVIILLTDGENNQQPDPLAAAQLAADRGVRIYTVIGSARVNLHVDGFCVPPSSTKPRFSRFRC
ncbi:MAG: VWA domain-containing protein [Anaerolineae bacterium]